MITSCCPGWVKYIKMNYPEMLKHVSTCKSPHQMYGALIKTFFASKNKIDPKDIYVVSVMPCIAKKYEKSLKEMKNRRLKDVDSVITTRELAKMIRMANIDFRDLKNEEYDNPLATASGAGAIFGVTGGVMEAALRTTLETLENKELDHLDYKEVRGMKNIKEASIEVGNKTIKVAVVSNLESAKIILEKIKKNENPYTFIEVMACPGGCINGGGQPIVEASLQNMIHVKEKRASALYKIDELSTIRKSHENPAVLTVYRKFLKKPGSEIAHKLLHTNHKKDTSFYNRDCK